MKRSLYRILLLAACACFLLNAAVPAKAEPYYAVTGIYDYALVSGTDSLNLRSGPGTEYQWLGSLAAGNWVGLLGESGNWYAVYLPQTGQFGYMSKNFLKRAEGGSGGFSTTGVVSNPKPTAVSEPARLPLLQRHGVGHLLLTALPFTCFSSTADGWYQVQISGMTGYFRKEYVKLNGGGQTAYVRSRNGGKVNLRSAPSYNGSTILGQYAPGTQVAVVLSSPLAGSFWKINVNGISGYMDSTYLTSSAPVYPVDPVYPGPAPATHGTAVVKNPKATQKLNLRAQPSTSAKVIAQYGNGVRFQVIRRANLTKVTHTSGIVATL
jgi:uncharacterized protein YgiM (DUF1202 family)